MRRKKLWNTVISSLLTGLLVLNAPLSVLATEVGLETGVPEEAAEMIVEESGELIVGEEGLSQEMQQPSVDGTQENEAETAQNQESEGGFTVEGIEVIEGNVPDTVLMPEAADTEWVDEKAAAVNEYTVTFHPVSALDQTPIADAKITVSYEDEYWEPADLLPNKDGSYTMDSYTEYTIQRHSCGI